MRAPAVPLTRKLLLAVVMGLLVCSLMPLGSAFAEGEKAPSTLLASSLMDGPASVVREDVALAAPEGDVAPEPVIGSFTVDGLTFAVIDESHVELVGVSSGWQQITSSQEDEDSGVASMQALGPDGAEADASTLALSESITYEGIDYDVIAVGPYAFYLSGVASVTLPASVIDVDDRAFRSSDVANVAVAEGNPTYSSFDGALYDAERLSLLLIPEGKQGTVLLPKTAESAAPSVFSHCPLVTQIAVEEGSAAFASENGLLYTSDLTTLLRVPAGATDIVIHDGCTTIAAGALEACASLATSTAPASVTSISPYLFEQEPETIMAPVAVSAVEDDAEGESAEDNESTDASPQLTAMVALSSVDDGLPEVDASAIDLMLSDGANSASWGILGLSVNSDEDTVEQGEAAFQDGVAIGADGGFQGIPGTANLMSASIAHAEYDTPIVTKKQVRGGTLQIGAVIISGTSPATIINGLFDGEVGWTSSSDTPQDTDVVTVRVTNYTPFDPSTSPNGNDYGLDAVLAMCRDRTIAKYPPNGLKPFYITIMSTGNEVSFSNLFRLPDAGSSTADTAWQFKILGEDLVGNATLRGSGTLGSSVKIGNGGYGVSIQYTNLNNNKTQYSDVTFDKNTTDTVSFNGHCGKACASPSNSLRMPTLSRKGYTHGWAASPSATTSLYGAGATIEMPFNQNTTLYAVWAKKPSLSVNLDKNATDATAGTPTVYYWPDKGYTTSKDSTDVVGVGSVIAANKPEREGYEFDGYWSQRSGGTQYVDKDGNLTADAPTIAAGSSSPRWYAHWKPTDYLIKLVTYGGDVDDDGWKEQSATSAEVKVYDRHYNIESDDIELPVPVRADYHFTGWTASNDSLPQLSVVIGKGSTGSRTYNANYEQIYKVSYSSAHGTPGRVSDSIYKGGSNIRLPSVTVDAGYTFNGWESSAWTGLMAADAEVSFAGTQNVTVTASFTKIEYTISLDTDGGSVSDSGWAAAVANSKYTKIYTVESAAVILPEPKRTGYTFTGWTGSNGTTPQTSVTVPMQSTGNRDYEAHWKAGTFTVKLDANGGSGGDEIIYEKFNDGWYTSPNAEPKYAITKVSVPTSEATEGNYVFNGYFWTDTEGNRIQCIDSTGKITAAASQFTQDATLVAEWASIAGVGIHANGGYLKYNSVTWQGDFCHQISNVKKCEILPDNSLYTLATDEVPRTIGSGSAEWELLGWSTSPNGPLLTAGDQPTDKDVVYYAQWKRPTQLVVFANGGALTFPYNNNWSGDGAWQFSSTVKFTVGNNAELTVGGTDRNREVTVPEGYDQMLLGWSWTPDGPILDVGTYVVSEVTRLYAVWGGSIDLWLHANSGALRYSGQCFWDDVSLPDGWRFFNSLRYVICEDGSIKVFDKDNTNNGRHVVANESKTDRILLGWARTPTGPRISSGAYGGAGKIDLYAFWQTSVVGFDPNGGAGGQGDSLPVTVGEAMPAISKEKPTRAGYLFRGWFDGPDYEQARQYYTEECDSARQWDIGCDATLYAGWEPISYTVSLEGVAGEDLGTFTAKYGEDLELPKLESQGWIFKGWEDAETMVVHQPGAVQNLRSEDGAHVTLRAKRVAAVSADAPIDVTVSVDLLGIEDQVPASGYIESRSGGALKVAAVDFAPLDGATALFGSRTADVALEALAGERATSAAVSFPLDAEATEADASKLAAFALPDGFGTRIPIGYRFAIPDDVLGTIDPAIFEQKTTPVCSVYYTVALANQEGIA